MTWRVAYAIDTLRAELDAQWPERSKLSDGTVGDAAHAARASDHNPADFGLAEDVVLAFDVTWDPINGPDLDDLAELLVADPRCHYVIWNRRIRSWAGDWAPYYGSNAHTGHLHLSVQPDRLLFDDARTWYLNVSGTDWGDEDDMPYRDWPTEDRNRLLDDISQYAVPHVRVQVSGGGTETLDTTLYRISRIESTLQRIEATLARLVPSDSGSRPAAP